MSWKNEPKQRQAAYYLPETRLMKTDEDEEEYIVIPEKVPEKQPVREPAKEPVKEPAKTGGWRKVTEDIDVSKKPKTINGEFLGYRHGNAAKKDGQWILHSPVQPMPWERGAVTAACGSGRSHTCPSCKGSAAAGGADCNDCEGKGEVSPAPKGGEGTDCRCGLYATWDEGELVNEHGDKSEWTTQVKAWGRVRTGAERPRVMRAQHMQITGIRPPQCEQCETPATHLISANEQALSGRPTCEEHKPTTISGGKTQVIATPIDEVCKELSNYYGGAMIRHQGEDWGSDDMADFEKDIGGKTSSWASVRTVHPKAGAEQGSVDSCPECGKTWGWCEHTAPKENDKKGFKSVRDVEATSPFAKEFKKVRNYATENGWRIEETSHGWQFKAPPGAIPEGRSGLVLTHGTPSDHRAFKNFLGDLRNHGGLIYPPERAKQQERKQQKQVLDLTGHDSRACLEAQGIGTSDLDDDGVVEMHEMAHEAV